MASNRAHASGEKADESVIKTEFPRTSTRHILAHFYSLDGHELLPGSESGFTISTYIIIRLEAHMTHVCVTARREDLSNTTSMGYRTDIEDTADMTQIPVQTLINYASCTSMRFIDYSHLNARTDGEVTVSPEEQDYYMNLSPNIQSRLTEVAIRRDQPILLELKFDPNQAAHQRVYVGIPQWATAFARCLQQGSINVVLEGSGSDIGTFQKVDAQFRSYQTSKNSPFDQFHRLRDLRVFSEDHIVTSPVKQVKTYDFRPRCSLFNKDEYLTIMGVHIVAEKQEAEVNVREFCKDPFNLRLMSIPQANNRSYIGFLPIPDESKLRLSKGTKLTLTFNLGGNWQDTELWNAYVPSQHVTMTPYGFLSLIVKRPWYEETKSFSNFVVHTVSTDTEDVSQAIVQDRGNRVKVDIESLNQIAGNLLRAAENMNFEPDKKPRTPWNDVIEEALLCSRLNKLVPQDIFRAVRGEYPDVTKVMELNDRQRLGILQAEKAPGGLLSVQGPPGTGKSKIIREIIKPFLTASKIHCVLVISSANIAVDSIALNLDAVLRKLVEQNLANAGRYGLRIHSQGSEKIICNLEAKKSRPISVKDVRPSTFANDIVWEELNGVTAEIVKTYQNETAVKFEGIPDSRVSYPRLSAGRKMLEITGVIQGPSTYPEIGRFASFRRLYGCYARGEQYEERDYDKAVDDAWAFTLRNASFLVATTSNGGLDRVVGTIERDLRLVLVDEAAHQREDYLLPFFSARFSQLDGFVQVGDWLQLAPNFDSTVEHDVFSRQGKLSFMRRLAVAGFESIELVEQHRMVEDIANLANFLTYDGRLVTSDRAKLDNRPVAKAFRTYIGNTFKKDTNLLLVDVVRCAANRTEMSPSMSRYNQLFVVLATDYVTKLLKVHPDASIAILTGYVAQKQCYLKAKAEMKRQNLPGVDRITVATFDASQGEEYDFVVVDIIVPNGGILGFQSDSRRLNVALTRARNGLIVLADVNAIKGNYRNRRSSVVEVLHYMRTVTTSSDKYERLPGSLFYRPERGY